MYIVIMLMCFAIWMHAWGFALHASSISCIAFVISAIMFIKNWSEK